ncbi:hypothetical protein BS78_03G245500 [Paspalum vaginatum]|nr:hypothetical protein BS78_03G245500 [Paspalum vaginatum]
MPKGAKKRAKLKKQQQESHPDDGGNTHANNGNGIGSDDNNNNASSRGDGDHHLRIPPKVSRVDASEDSMESSEEMVTPRAAASEADEEEKKAAAAEVPVERAVEADGAGAEEVMAEALPPETAAQERGGKVDAVEVEVHALAAQEPEVKDVVVAEESTLHEPEATEAPAVEVLEVKREVAKVHPVHELGQKVDDVVVFEDTPVVPEVQEPEVKCDSATVVVQEPETKGGNVVVKESAEVSRSREAVDVHTTEVVRGPAVAVAASGQRATWWNCCGIFDAFAGSER